jgi:hypothetical protein
MALTSLFVKNPQGPRFNIDNFLKREGQVLEQNFEVDCSVSEQYEHTADITSNPVERGLDVNDHYNPRPVRITLEMVHSDSPIKISNLVSGLVTNAGQTIGANVIGGGAGRIVGGVGASYGFGALASLVTKQSLNRSQTAYQQFVNMMNNGSVFTLITGLDVYPDMMVENITVNRVRNTGKALSFSVTAKRIRFVNSEEIEAPRIANLAVNDRVQKKTETGKQAAKQPSPQRTSIVGSVFRNIFGGS